MNTDETTAQLEKRVEALEKELVEMRRSELSLEQITDMVREVVREELRHIRFWRIISQTCAKIPALRWL
jgi:hypothetical protein